MRCIHFSLQSSLLNFFNKNEPRILNFPPFLYFVLKFSVQLRNRQNNKQQKKSWFFGGKVSLAYPQTSKKVRLLSISKQQKTDMKGRSNKKRWPWKFEAWRRSYLKRLFFFCRFSLEGIAKQQPFLSAFPHAPELGQCLYSLEESVAKNAILLRRLRRYMQCQECKETKVNSMTKCSSVMFATISDTTVVLDSKVKKSRRATATCWLKGQSHSKVIDFVYRP